MAYARPVPLDKRHVVEGFDCGEPALNKWLTRHALGAQASGSARVFVTVADDNRVDGYYALAAAQVQPTDASVRLGAGQSRERPIPVVLLARLAVDREHQGFGLGESLLRDSMSRAALAAETIGLRAIVVHAKHDDARRWYAKYDFEESPTDPLHLILLMKDLRKALDRE